MKHTDASPDQFALFDEPPRLREVSDELGVIGVRADQAEHREVPPEPESKPPAVAISLADRAMAMSEILDYYDIQARADGIRKIRTKSPGDNNFDNRYSYRSDDIYAEVESKAKGAEVRYDQALDTLTSGEVIRASAEEHTEDDIALYRTKIKSELNKLFRTDFNKDAPTNRNKARDQLGITKETNKKTS